MRKLFFAAAGLMSMTQAFAADITKYVGYTSESGQFNYRLVTATVDETGSTVKVSNIHGFDQGEGIFYTGTIDFQPTFKSANSICTGLGFGQSLKKTIEKANCHTRWDKVDPADERFTVSDGKGLTCLASVECMKP